MDEFLQGFPKESVEKLTKRFRNLEDLQENFLNEEKYIKYCLNENEEQISKLFKILFSQNYKNKTIGESNFKALIKDGSIHLNELMQNGDKQEDNEKKEFEIKKMKREGKMNFERGDDNIRKLESKLSKEVNKSTHITSISNKKDLHPLFQVSGLTCIDDDLYTSQFKPRNEREINSIFLTNDYIGGEDVGNNLEKRLLYWMTISKILIININKEISEDDRKIFEKLIKIKEQLSKENDNMPKQLYILVHEVNFQNQILVKQKIEENLKDILDKLRIMFEVSVIYLTPTLVKRKPHRLINRSEICPSHLFTLDELTKEIYLYSSISSLNKGSGENGKGLLYFMKRLNDHLKKEDEIQKINLQDIWKLAIKDLLSHAHDQSTSKYLREMNGFISSKKTISLKNLMKRHNQVVKDKIIPQFMDIVKGIPVSCMYLVDLAISSLLKKLCTTAIKNRQTIITGGLLYEIMHKNDNYSKISSSETLSKFTKRIREEKSTSESKIDQHERFIQITDDFEKEKTKMGTFYFSTYFSLIDIFSDFLEEVQSKEPKELQYMRNILEKKKGEIKDEEEKQYLSFSKQIQTFTDLSFSFIHQVYIQHYSLLLTFYEKTLSSRKLGKEIIVEMEKEKEKIQKLLLDRQNLFKLIAPSKHTQNIGNKSSSKQDKLYVSSQYKGLYGHMERKALLPHRFINSKTVFISNTQSQSLSIDSNQTVQNVPSNHYNLKKIKPYFLVDKLKKNTLIINQNGDEFEDNTPYIKGVSPVVIRNENGSFTLELIFKYKTNTQLPLSSSFSLLDKIIEGKNVKIRDNFYNKIKFTGELPKDKNLMLVGNMSMGKFDFFVPIFICH